MELRQLEYFQMASRLKNITRAAERLRVSQPNITVAIKKLEGELGIQLFDRSQKQLSLTPEGAVFLGRVGCTAQHTGCRTRGQRLQAAAERDDQNRHSADDGCVSVPENFFELSATLLTS